jgi:metal-dependent amidase/aminoacylase/carboxypeptidase family protein
VIEAAGTVAPATPSVAGDFIMTSGVRSAADPGGGAWTLRTGLATTSPAMRVRAERGIRAGLDSLAARGVSYTLDYAGRIIPGVNNDSTLERRARATLRAELGDSGLVVLRSIPPMFSEDFGFFQDEVPGVMFFLGVSNASKGWVGMPHSPGYVADEESILVGARAMAAVMLGELASKGR